MTKQKPLVFRQCNVEYNKKCKKNYLRKIVFLFVCCQIKYYANRATPPVNGNNGIVTYLVFLSMYKKLSLYCNCRIP